MIALWPETILIRDIRQSDRDSFRRSVGELALRRLRLLLRITSILQLALLLCGDPVTSFIAAKQIVEFSNEDG